MRTVSFSIPFLRRLAVLSFLGFMLTACGGGGDNPPDGNNPGGNNPPGALTLVPLTDVAPDLFYVSNTLTVTDIGNGAAIGIMGSECAYSVDDSAFTTDVGTVSNSQKVRVQARSAKAYEAVRTCTLTLGNETTDFTVTTGRNSFAFDIQPGKLSLTWDNFSGVTRYELTRHNSATGESVFVAEDIGASATEFTTLLSAHLTDWINDRFTLSACNDSGCVSLPDHDVVLEQELSAKAINYVKASNTGILDQFGYSVALDGNTLAVGAAFENSAASGDQANDSADNSGAVYIFKRDTHGNWTQAAYLKASNIDAGDEFGYSIALDGKTLAVGAFREDSNATGVNGDQTNNDASNSGAVYIFHQNDDGEWVQSAYLKASNTDTDDGFGNSLALDGDTLAVGARRRDSDEVGSVTNIGAVYVFKRTDIAWEQTAYLKASNPGLEDQFGARLALDGNTLAVSAPYEDDVSNTQPSSGAVYIFQYADGTWTETHYLKASTARSDDQFGYSLALDSGTLVVGARLAGGKVHVFQRADNAWEQTVLLESPHRDPKNHFGSSIALNGDTLAVSETDEDSSAVGVGGNPGFHSQNSGAVYIFERDPDGVWAYKAYLKASNTNGGDAFGSSLALDGDTVAVGVHLEDSVTIGINGEQADNSARDSGAVYIY